MLYIFIFYDTYQFLYFMFADDLCELVRDVV